MIKRSGLGLQSQPPSLFSLYPVSLSIPLHRRSRRWSTPLSSPGNHRHRIVNTSTPPSVLLVTKRAVAAAFSARSPERPLLELVSCLLSPTTASMKVVALVSGGKDSCYAMMKCVQYGHEIVALANLMPSNDSVDELDSYMYQTVGHQIVVSYAKCMGLPLFRRRIQGSTRHQKLGYKMTPGDEVEDMFILLSEIKRKIPSITAVSSGAISSDYQRLRVESVCSRLGLVSLAYLWKQDQAFLLQEMITNGIKAITVKVASLGLDPAKHLGKEISYLKPYLHQLEEKYGINICGEGGEYETLTLDCPLFL